MGYPRFLEGNTLLSEWVRRGEIALAEEDYDPRFAFDVAAEVTNMWVAGLGEGEITYLEMVWDADPGGLKPERMFWEICEARTVRYSHKKYTERFEILRRVQDFRYDEWGIRL